MVVTKTRVNRFRMPAALAGAGAIVAMGIIGAIVNGTDGATTSVVSGGSMTTGETTTVTYSGTIAPVVAIPAVKAKPFGEG